MVRKLIICLCTTIMCAYTYAAEDSPLWLRKNSISPDGKKIAFSYQGDIFTVAAEGGRAIQITSNPAYESDPIWTPDGKHIVFSSTREKSKDIFITSAEGGIPERVTDYPGDETPLAVTPDGSILFSADIQPDPEYSGFPGSAQIYSISAEGGRPRLVTSLPIASLSIGNDGTVLYEDIKGYEDPFRKHHTSSVTRDIWLYTPAGADIKGSRDATTGGEENDDDIGNGGGMGTGSKGNHGKRDTKDTGNNGNGKGAVKGSGNTKGSGARLSIDGTGTFTKLSSFKGEDRNPVFAADGDTDYYISEKDGSFNIYKADISAPGQETQITFLKKHPVRYISVSKDGTVAFSYNGELYTVREGSEPVKVGVEIIKDSNERDKARKTISSGITAIAVSPNGKEIAVVARGDVFVTSVDYSTSKRITDTPEQERDVCFSPDGRTLYYSAERDGHWGIYATSLTGKDDKYFTYSVNMEEKAVTGNGQTCFQPAVSPDGKWIGFLRDRTEIVVKNLKTGKEKSLLKGVNYSYSDGDQYFEWSPDSRYILCNYQADGGWNNEDIALIDIESGTVTNLTESGYTDSNFRWAMKGKAMTWQSDKAGYRSHGSWGAEEDIYIMFFDGKAYTDFTRDKEAEDMEDMLAGKDSGNRKEAADSVKTGKKTEKLLLDLDNIEDRTVRLTRFSGSMGDYYLTDDGSKLYYVTRTEQSYDLCVLDIKESEIKVVARNTAGPIYPGPDGKYIYILSSGISRIDVASGERKQVTFSGEYDYRPAQEREYIFSHIWKQVEEKFYDPGIHGVDWKGYREAYRRFLPYIDNNYDFQEMLSEMLGELNGSHTGARYYAPSGERMGTLGVLYDEDYEGDGLKIKEVLKGGVLAAADPEISAGDIITAIDGERIEAGKSWYDLLVSKTGKKVLLTIKKGGKKEVGLYVEPSGSDYGLLYRRWVRRNEELVRKLSGGRVGYVHVEGMDSPSFREVYSRLLGKYRSCEAVVVDTRHNGGGWLHDDLATLLSGKAYIRFEPRGQYIGSDPYNKWNKPSCVLIGEDNYSDACGFPYVYRTLGIGKLIGAPVPGTMTAVWWERQIDPTLVFGIPQVGAIGVREGRYIENMQIEPDIPVYNDPASVLNGEDRQLEAAVEEMMKTIGAK